MSRPETLPEEDYEPADFPPDLFFLLPELEEEDSRARTALDAYSDHFRLDRRPLRRVYEKGL